MAAYTIHDLTVSVLTPLHIGTGRELLHEYDYSIHGGRTWRLNESALLDAQDVADPALVERLAQTPPARLLRSQDYRPASGLFRYVLRGTPRSQAVGAQLREQIKDVFDRPYLPGSSLKGALRTALAWNIWQKQNMLPATNKTSRDYERTIFGPDPNHDFLRALHVSDSAPVDAEHLQIQNARVMDRGGDLAAPISMEAIAKDTEFCLRLKIDEVLLSGWAVRNGLRSTEDGRLRNMSRDLQNHSVALVRQEIEWFRGVRGAEAEELVKSYQLLNQLSTHLRGRRGFLIRLGWGTGWDSKTFGSHLQADDDLMDSIARRFPLSRKTHRKGDLFPKSRRVAVGRQGTPGSNVMPWGWCLVAMKERNQ